MNSNKSSYLDTLWSAGGPHHLKQFMSVTAQSDRAEALRLINDEHLRFPVLFILMPEISAHGLYGGLSPRNMAAISICSKKMYKHSIDTAVTDATNDTLYLTLKWMFETGKDWDGLSVGHDPYDAVIDYTVALLIISYEDKKILKDVAELIFRRNRKGFFIHDLVWSFFQTLDKDALSYVAGYLLSDNPRDIDLAAKLLNLDEQVSNRVEARKTYRKFIEWLDNNRPYLYLTGEHFQLTSNPRHLDADKEAKYLGKEILPRYRAPVEPLTEAEVDCLHNYRVATPEDQALLTDYSHNLRHSNKQLWQEWMHKQPAEQVLAARMTRTVI